MTADKAKDQWHCCPWCDPSKCIEYLGFDEAVNRPVFLCSKCGSQTLHWDADKDFCWCEK